MSKIKDMVFEEAFKALKKGKEISRDNDFWESKGLYLSIKEIKEDNDRVIEISNNGGTKSYYTPNQSDLFADDWYVV